MYARAHDSAWLLDRWVKLARRLGADLQELVADEGGFPVFALVKTGVGEAFYASAGVHGDEPGAALGLLRWAETRLPEGPFVIVPLVNPSGLSLNTRLDHRGDDLNRNFNHDQPLMAAWRRLLKGWSFYRAACLHEDYGSTGLYLYEMRRGGPPIDFLTPVEGVIPRNTEGTIDGWEFQNGISRHEVEKIGALKASLPGYPESLWLFENHCAHVMTFETPSEFDLERRMEAHGLFLDACFR